MVHPLTAEVICDEAALRELLGEPLPLVCAKVSDHLTEHTRRFVELAPFVCLATSDELGNCDVSPRGDPTGFVRILDERTLLLPERPGNRLADSLRNMLRNRHVGILFVIPGVDDTFRVNGRATLTTDAALLAPSAVEGKPPRLGILVDIETAYTQCSKAFLRSHLWIRRTFASAASCRATARSCAASSERRSMSPTTIRRARRDTRGAKASTEPSGSAALGIPILASPRRRVKEAYGSFAGQLSPPMNVGYTASTYGDGVDEWCDTWQL